MKYEKLKLKQGTGTPGSIGNELVEGVVHIEQISENWFRVSALPGRIKPNRPFDLPASAIDFAVPDLSESVPHHVEQGDLRNKGGRPRKVLTE